jgi:hypothetical protein
MFKGPKPEGQPRSLRSIAEGHNEHFENPDMGLEGTVYPVQYHDAARVDASERPSSVTPRAETVNKNPFKSLRGGK